MVVFKTRVGRYRYRDENAPDDAAFRLCWSERGFELRPPDAPDRAGIRAVLPPDAAGGRTGARRNPLPTLTAFCGSAPYVAVGTPSSTCLSALPSAAL